MATLRILLTGGGTGGHTYPLVAVARAIRQKRPDAELYFAGPTNFGRGDLEKEGIAVYHLVAGKFRRYFSFGWIADIVKFPVGFAQALALNFWVLPDVVFSKGGYGAVPVVLTARLLRIPVVIHESDVVPGMANRLTARFAAMILIAFPEARVGFRARDQRRVYPVGNPVRTAPGAAGSGAASLLGIRGGRPIIAVLGGSQGAERLNDLTLMSLGKLLEFSEVVHQTGQKNIDRVKEAAGALVAASALEYWHASPFFSEAELQALFAVADLIVSRAGAGAIFEIAASGRPSVLIPLTEGSRGEQIKNAYAYARSGAALVLEEGNCSSNVFVKTIRDLLHDEALRREMSAAAGQFARPGAAGEIAQAILELGSKN